MAEFKSFDPDVEVAGEVISAFMAGFPPRTEKMGVDILEKQGIVDPKPGSWYPLQPFLNAMKDISDRLGPHVLERIGRQIATNAILPPEIGSLEQCLESIDVAYHMNHRGGEIGSYRYINEGVRGGLNRATMECPNCYPCAFDSGVIEGFAERFKPPDSIGFTVRHDETGPCRRRGAESCRYIVSWG